MAPAVHTFHPTHSLVAASMCVCVCVRTHACSGRQICEGTKKKVLLRLSQCKHGTAGRAALDGFWLVAGTKAWAPIITLTWINTHTHTHRPARAHAYAHWHTHNATLSGPLRPSALRVTAFHIHLKAKWLSCMHPPIRKCQERVHARARVHTRKHTKQCTCTNNGHARTHIYLRKWGPIRHNQWQISKKKKKKHFKKRGKNSMLLIFPNWFFH